MASIGGILRWDGSPVPETALFALRRHILDRSDGIKETQFGTGVVLMSGQDACASTSADVVSAETTDGFARHLFFGRIRIDNRKELIAALRAVGRAPENNSDTDLAVAAFSYWGKNFVDQLIGDYAFVIWDMRHRTAYCVRDRIGVRPFYYANTEKFFAFSDAPQMLSDLPGVSSRLNNIRVADYIAPMLQDKCATFFEGIKRLPPGALLMARPGQVTQEEYWHPSHVMPPTHYDEREAADQFRELFFQAVECRLRPDVKAGVTLSGGLDSSSVAAVASHILARTNKDLVAITACFDKVPECDERAYVEPLNEALGLHSVQVAGDAEGPLTRLEEFLTMQGEPFIAPNLMIHAALCRRASAAGVRLLLDGHDGDNAVSHGNYRLAELVRSLRLLSLIREVGAFSARSGWRRHRVLLSFGLLPGLPPLRMAHKIWKTRHRNDLVPLIRSDFLRSLEYDDRLRQFGDPPIMPKDDHEFHVRSLAHGLQPLLFETVDKVHTSLGLEARHPFMDSRLIEFCLGLPADLKLRDGWNRWIVRRALQNDVPPKTVWRERKSNLNPNFLHGLLQYDRWRLENLASSDAEVLEPFVDIPQLKAMVSQFLARPHPREGALLFRLCVLARWLHGNGQRAIS